MLSGFVCEGYEQDESLEMCKYNFYFVWDFFFGEGAQFMFLLINDE